ncbi:hypothetical protein M8818_003000 [Zalaria obscura]|uniref:Uncharacterized protein n=1 Tax=Zalaria obscura TaxID=2024903 RepID=A0ACC3SG22_9PEZI
MPPKKSIADFFKPFAELRRNRDLDATVYDNITVASSHNRVEKAERTAPDRVASGQPKRRTPNLSADLSPAGIESTQGPKSKDSVVRTRSNETSAPSNTSRFSTPTSQKPGQIKRRLRDTTSSTREFKDASPNMHAAVRMEDTPADTAPTSELTEFTSGDVTPQDEINQAHDDFGEPERIREDQNQKSRLNVSFTSTLSSLGSRSSSPDLPDIDALPARPTKPAAAGTANRDSGGTNLSFNSLSGLSQTSSRRIVQDGVPVVTNSSDAGSEEEELQDEDDTSLDDIDDLIKRAKKRRKIALSTEPQTPALDVAQGAGPRRELRSTRQKSRPARPSRVASPPNKAYKFSLAALAKQMKKDELAEARIKDLEGAMEKVGATAESPQSSADDADVDLNEDIVKTLDDGDEDMDVADRLTHAMKRTDALIAEIRFHCFQQREEEDRHRKEFPVHSLPDTEYMRSPRDPKTRDVFLTSGFPASMARSSPLPTEVLQWMVDELPYETDELRLASYAVILRPHVCDQVPFSSIVTHDVLAKFGLRQDVLDSSNQVCDKGLPMRPARPARDVPPGLKTFFKLLATEDRCVQLIPLVDASANRRNSIPYSSTSSLLHHLMLMLIDENIQHDTDTRQALQEAIMSTLAPLRPLTRGDVYKIIRDMCDTIIPALPHPVLFHRLLTSLPSVDSHTPLLKRHLALAFTLDSLNHLPISDPTLSDSTLTARVTAQLRTSPYYAMTEATDFAALGARFAILDVAIGAGFSDFSWRKPHRSPHRSATTATATTITDIVASPAPKFENMRPGVRKAPPVEEAEAQFNTAIDTLVSQLRLVASRIKDAGAAHMRRTECKGVIERLCARLEFCVRTRVKRRKDVFGGGALGGAGVLGMKGFMDGFVRREGRGKGEVDGEGEAVGGAEADMAVLNGGFSRVTRLTW